MNYKYPENPNDWKAIIAWKEKMQSRDWDNYIEKGKVKNMLLGNTPEFFMPDDGKSQGSIKYYRWFHNHSIVVNRIFKHYDKVKKYNELKLVLTKAINELINKDIFISLEIISALAGAIYYNESDKDVDYETIYKKIKFLLKEKFEVLENTPESFFNIPPEYPGKFKKIISSTKKYLEELEKRY